ncbi:KPN_02809 family neutral zinc metallopeptidase [Phenylobacterium sp.]|uniref:KPN_02809 family neutral zinc metallopeptidase n=1 Tax=Phenylobacterium sp. TaxID=1871053 RepID=UPI003003051B
MRWRGGRRSGNISDRRGMGPVAGGLGVGGVVLALIGYFVFGIDPTTTLSVVNGTGAPAAESSGVRGAPDDEAGQFVDVIETSTAEVWTEVFAQAGRTYEPPAAVVLYEQSTNTRCGTGQAAMGPFYCPADRMVYLDLSFWDDLENRFGAEGEAARAYVIAHEIAHHVQNLTGQMDKAQRLGSQGAESGAVRLELQADCYAGVWAARAEAASGGAVALGPDDIAQGLAAASAIGDDTLQKQSQGRVVPDAFTHGSSAQRMAWFRTGAQTGDPKACDTFSAARL